MATAEVKLNKAEFTNERFVDFSNPENRSAMEAALKKVAGEFGREYPMYIDGEKVTTAEKIKSTNPSHPSQVIGVVQSASAEQARQAIESAHAYFGTWKRVPAEKRAGMLFRAAEITRQRKFEISAVICYEVGKSWVEADADTAETIDFLEYYGREMLRLAGPHKVVPHQNERNFMVYIPLGAGAAIPPWNFPAAIATGMTAAALVAGNTLVLKPSEESPVIGTKMVEILYEAGVPKQALQFVTGLGEIAGDALVKHPETRVERTKKVSVGPAEDPGNYMGPVVSEGALQGILNYIEVGRKEGKVVAGGGRAPGDGYFVQPTVIADVDPKARVAQEEIFGPVLAVIRARDFDHALEIANDTEFGLTGAVYSKNKAKLEKAEEVFHVGNLYLNRKCTGAMVGAHPFGGFNMSGTDSKTGGKDYLLHFLQAKSIAEKVV